MAVRAGGFATETKRDASPVTEADRAAEKVILEGLRAAMPDLAIVAEEEASRGVRVEPAGRFVLVDPLDGTREFVAGNDDFTVNIALVENGVPVTGVVHVPATGATYTGGPDGATRDGAAIACGPRATPPRVVASRSHRTPETDRWIAAHVPGCETVAVGSSLKFCLLAEGRADLYPRFGATMEWDTAAGDAVLRAAGGAVFHPDGQAFGYGKARYRNGDFVACAGRTFPF